MDEDDIDSQFLQAVTSGNAVAVQDWISRLHNSTDAKTRFTRTFLAAIKTPGSSLGPLLSTGLIDWHAEKEINSRNCLHEAAIYNQEEILLAGLEHGVDASRVDIYGRLPLHYACTHGHVLMIQKLLSKENETIDMADHDNFTPLIHSVIHQRLRSVQQLLTHGARYEPDSDADHIPLNLACQYESVDIIKLLLLKGAKITADAEGLFPQHLVARSGRNPKNLLVLEQHGADLNQRDKLYQWTPLFHAAAEGRVECLNSLLDRGADVGLIDEKGFSALYYAAWEGHLECMRLLSTMRDSSKIHEPLYIAQRGIIGSDSMSTSSTRAPGADDIPDLSLPPPIIPLPRYGHNFLDKQTYVQISFEANGAEPIIFYSGSKYPAARLTVSCKSNDVIPRNVMLPIQDDSRTISFQVDSLENFTVDFEIYPTFGSKIIAKTVALSNHFNARASSCGQHCLPLFDPRIRAIGQISFKYQVVKPLHGVPLEITEFATYWKATSQLESHPGALITGSSLSGDYVHLFIQLTSDGVPVLYPSFCIDFEGLEIPVGRLTYEQYLSVGLSSGRRSNFQDLPVDGPLIHEWLLQRFISLEEVLENISTEVHFDLKVLYPRPAEEDTLGLSSALNINDFADAILNVVFDHARATKERSPDSMRSIVFSSYNPDVCAALNWKQPNCKW